MTSVDGATAEAVRGAEQGAAWPVLLAVIGPMLAVPRAVEVGTLLADLGLDDLDRDVIAMELGDALGIEICGDAARRWQSLADVLATAADPRCACTRGGHDEGDRA